MKSERYFRPPETGHPPRALGTDSLSLFAFHFSPFISCLRCLVLLLGFLLLSSSANAAGASTGAYPVDPASYHDDGVTFIPAKLWGRVQTEPLNLIATVIFALAITHSFLSAQFLKRSRSIEHRLLRLE